jgi:ATP-dependent RNA helicase DeaD
VDSFDELGLAPELVDLLASEGIERPTPFQEQVLPVVRRGNNLVGRAGPGGGTLVAWGAALVERLALPAAGDSPEAESDAGTTPMPGAGAAGPRALVLCTTADAAARQAESLAALAGPMGLRVASASGAWVLPERADVLFGTPRHVLGWVREGRTSLESVETVVVDQITVLASLEGLDDLETVVDFLPAEAQRVVLDVPTRDTRARTAQAAAEDFVKRHVRRGVTVPPRSAEDEDAPHRGSLEYRIVDEPADDDGLALVAELLHAGDLRHLAVFFRDEARAADVGDHLALHGFAAGPPGDPSSPVWLAVDELDCRTVLDAFEPSDTVGVLSWDPPFGPDSLDRRHGGGRGGHVLVLPREVPHLRDVARRTGYDLTPAPPPAESRIPDDLVRTVEQVETALRTEDVGAYMLVLESLFEEHDPAEVAAAALALLRKRGLPGETAGPAGTGSVAPGATGTPAAARGPAWVRLFVSVGHKDRAGPGDIVGAITGETDVDASQVGRIDMRDSFSIVEVEERAAERVIRGLNGTTVKGRSVRVDYDRGGQRGGGGASGRSGRRGSGGPGRGRSGGKRPPGDRRDA